MNPTIDTKIQKSGSGAGTRTVCVPQHYAGDLKNKKVIILTGDYSKEIELKHKSNRVSFTLKKYSGFEIGEMISLTRKKGNVFVIRKVVIE